MTTVPSADQIEQIAFGFMASKVLFTAIEFRLFTELAKGPLDANQIQSRLKLNSEQFARFSRRASAKPSYIENLFQNVRRAVLRFNRSYTIDALGPPMRYPA
jgi:hypothetical protein